MVLDMFDWMLMLTVSSRKVRMNWCLFLLLLVKKLWHIFLRAIGTNCINLPNTKVLLQLFQECLRLTGSDQVSILPSITNVTHRENFEFLLNGADLVYHLPLSALLLHTLYTEDTTILQKWISELPVPPKGHALFNLAASHDGVGLSWCRDILTTAQIQFLMKSATERGGNRYFSNWNY